MFDVSYFSFLDYYPTGKSSLSQTMRTSIEGEGDNRILTVALDMPGVKKADIKVTFTEGVLSVTAQRDGTSLYSDISISRSYRSTPTASLQDGVLRIKFAFVKANLIPVE